MLEVHMKEWLCVTAPGTQVTCELSAFCRSTESNRRYIYENGPLANIEVASLLYLSCFVSVVGQLSSVLCSTLFATPSKPKSIGVSVVTMPIKHLESEP